ncbi:MAG: hypothetical protein Q4C70_09565, partial [Planctomycetia bacterium]|nr:hypothetical protein [Planctomycetia bacterium]
FNFITNNSNLQEFPRSFFKKFIIFRKFFAKKLQITQNIPQATYSFGNFLISVMNYHNNTPD